jgi:hypothetical protein
MHVADRARISYLAWTWNTEADYGGCSNALLGPLSAYYSGAPSGYGAGGAQALPHSPRTPSARYAPPLNPYLIRSGPRDGARVT